MDSLCFHSLFKLPLLCALPFKYYTRIRMVVAVSVRCHIKMKCLLSEFRVFKDSAWERNKNIIIFLPCCSQKKLLCVGLAVTEKAPPSFAWKPIQLWQTCYWLLHLRNEETERVDWSSPDVRGFWSQRSLFCTSFPREKSVMAELSSVQVTDCTWALLLRPNSKSPLASGHLLRSKKKGNSLLDFQQEGKNGSTPLIFQLD